MIDLLEDSLQENFKQVLDHLEEKWAQQVPKEQLPLTETTIVVNPGPKTLAEVFGGPASLLEVPEESQRGHPPREGETK